MNNPMPEESEPAPAWAADPYAPDSSLLEKRCIIPGLPAACFWDEIGERYPMIVMESTAARRAFFDLYNAMGGRANDALAIADLVMVFPPQE